MADLGPDDLTVVFTFARAEAGTYRDASGSAVVAPVNVPRFDHAEDGTPLGLLVDRGSDIGQGERLALDPLILPVELVESDKPEDRMATVFHRWLPEGATAERRDAWYTRNAPAAIDALMRQAGHHRAIGVTRGFAIQRNGEVRLRTGSWRTAGYLLATPGAALTDGAGGTAQPVILAGPAPID